ncbi:hypothetical protein ACFQ5E_23595 [Oceanobacillus sojae]
MKKRTANGLLSFSHTAFRKKIYLMYTFIIIAEKRQTTPISLQAQKAQTELEHIIKLVVQV